MASTLEIKDLHVSIEDKEILKGVNLTINTDEIHAIMGPNGTGKSTLSSAIMGHPSYEVTKGEVLLDGVNILELEVDERAKAGLFFFDCWYGKYDDYIGFRPVLVIENT